MGEIFPLAGLSAVLLFSGCAATVTPPKAFADQALWTNVSKDKAFSACLTALQLEGFEIHPMGTNKDTGLIVTGKVEFYPFENFDLIKGYYSLQILVSEIRKNEVMVDFQVKASWRKTDPGAWGFNLEDLQNRINNRVSEDLARVFSRMEALLGKPEKKRGGRVLVWKKR